MPVRIEVRNPRPATDPYLEQLVERIRIQLVKISANSGINAATGTVVEVQFHIDSRTGAITVIDYVSGNPSEKPGIVCVSAVTSASPYGPVPVELNVSAAPSIALDLVFSY